MNEQEQQPTVFDPRVMCGFPVPSGFRVTAHNAYEPPFTHWFMQHARAIEGTAPVEGGAEIIAFREAPQDLSGFAVPKADGGEWTVADALEATWTDGFLVLHDGAVVVEQYFRGMRPDSTHLWQSVSKSLGSCVLSRLAERGLIDTEAPVTAFVPELEGSAYGDARIRHLLDMTVGIRFSEDYADDDSEIARLDRLYGARPPRNENEPGSSYDMATEMVKEREHGEAFHYVSLDLQVMGWVMERATGTSMPELISREVWSRLGTEHEAYIALDGAGSAQLEGGFCSSLRDFARFGWMLCKAGRIDGRQVVAGAWIEDTLANGDEALFAASNYGGLVPRGAYRNNFWTARIDGRAVLMGRGIYGQRLYVNHEAKVVVVKFSTYPVATDTLLAQQEFALFEALAQHVSEGAGAGHRTKSKRTSDGRKRGRT